ncbi:hypothetical protein [Streptomyces natalensis]|uniref:Uncharacterized protein n=1 Tax=Streptomyces natalensis ATCC 27448 TaxID=1240678 RepID=A0A0D7CSM4_9ACTN|nr:hypothetical protein [Streptomyces natalensis]KIZ19239.1 hypothetical protein SNA_01465 [Streptomyces natalensis ATCC 27448]
MDGSTIIPITIILIAFASVVAIVASYFKLQRHRADAAALAEYRKLAEQVAAGQQAMNERLAELTDRVKAVEKLLQSVG